MDRPTAWPDGRKLGGVNGYPPEWHQWAEECELKFVLREMLSVPKESRKAVHDKWLKKFPHATTQRLKIVWNEVVAEKMQHSRATKRNSCAITQRKRNNSATVGGSDALRLSKVNDISGVSRATRECDGVCLADRRARRSSTGYTKAE